MTTNVNLANYKFYPSTQSCYLDGRYFNKVFANYPGLIHKPLNISVIHHNGQLKDSVMMKQSKIDTQYPGLLRVIINSNGSRHSNVLILDYNNKKIFRYDPNGTSSPYYNEVNQIIKNYLGMYFIDFTLVDINIPVKDNGNPTCKAKGINNGFCVAYVIKFAYDWLNNKQYDPSEIMKFTGAIETIYGPLDNNKVDMEYGFFDGPGPYSPGYGPRGFNTQGALIGGVGGLALGGLVGGLPGAALGGLAGGAIGGML